MTRTWDDGTPPSDEAIMRVILALLLIAAVLGIAIGVLTLVS